MKKLPNAPLQEVIFEIRWELDIDPKTKQSDDTGFELASGRLHKLLENRFSHYQRKVPSSFPEQLLHFNTVHQYWTAEGKWPVIQLGPGIFTVNDTDVNYQWEEQYFPLVLDSLKKLHEAYGVEAMPINFVNLRYINSVKLEEHGFDDDWQKFVLANFNFNFKNSFNTRGKLKQIQFNQYFELEDNSELQINFSSGKRDDQNALIWQAAIMKSDNFRQEGIEKWLESAHQKTHDLLTEMTQKDFYASFTQQK